MARFPWLAPSMSLHGSVRPLRACSVLVLLSLGGCSETSMVPGPGSGGAVGTGGAVSTGGATGTGGATATGGAVATGGATGSGGASSGGATASGGTASGGAGATDSGGSSSGGAGASGGSGGSLNFGLIVAGVDATDNDDCQPAPDAGTCPLYPEDATSFGENLSPSMNWGAAPPGTLSFALTLVDLSNNDFAHWALWDIPGESLALPGELPEGGVLTGPTEAMQANNFGGTAYFGSGQCMNVYEFRLYALDTATLAPANAADPDSVITALEALTPLGETFVRMQSRDYCP